MCHESLEAPLPQPYPQLEGESEGTHPHTKMRIQVSAVISTIPRTPMTSDEDPRSAKRRRAALVETPTTSRRHIPELYLGQPGPFVRAKELVMILRYLLN